MLAPRRVIKMRVGIRVVSKHMKNMRILSEEKVSIKNIIMMETSRRNIFLFLVFFWFIRFLARKHRGASQHLKIISGVDKVSFPSFMLIFFHVRVWFFSRLNEARVSIEKV